MPIPSDRVRRAPDARRTVAHQPDRSTGKLPHDGGPPEVIGTLDPSKGEPEPTGRSKGERTRMAIVQAAIVRFVAEGFQRTSMADVARDVGLSPSALYRYFPTKEALFITAVDADAVAMIDLVQAATIDAGDHSVVEMLARIRAELLAAVDGHPLAARALTGVEPMSPERIMALPHLAALRERLTARLAAGQRAGTVRTDVPADTLALGIETIVLYQLAHLASLRGVEVHLDHDRWGAIATIIDAALRPPPTTPNGRRRRGG